MEDFIENSDQPDFSINPDIFEELELDKYDSSTQNDSEDEDNDEDEEDEEDEDEEEDEEEEEEEEDEVDTFNNGKNILSNHAGSNRKNRNRGKSNNSACEDL